MTAPVCRDTPVSWLRLERYALGELPAGASAEVAAHLAGCPACRSCLERIETDVRPLPPLPVPWPAPLLTAVTGSPAAAGQQVAARPRWLKRPERWLGAGTLLAAAAAALLLLLPVRPPEAPQLPGARTTAKGGELALVLVRERQGQVTERPSGWAPGDRFELLATCPPGPAPRPWELAVFQDGTASFPLAPQARRADLRCANRVLLPGAFRLTGRGPATVCLLVGDEGPPLPGRDQLRRRGPAALPAGSACLVLPPRPR